MFFSSPLKLEDGVTAALGSVLAVCHMLEVKVSSQEKGLKSKVGTAGTNKKMRASKYQAYSPSSFRVGRSGLVPKSRENVVPSLHIPKGKKELVQPPANRNHPEPGIFFSTVENKPKSPILEDCFSEGHYPALLYNVQRSQAEQNSETR